MNAYWGVIVPATESVQPIQMPPAMVVSIEADVPPNVWVAGRDPAAGIPVANHPVPIAVELAPAAPIVLITQTNSKYQGCAVVAPGVVSATTLAPIVGLEIRGPKRGVIISVPVEANDMMPPA